MNDQVAFIGVGRMGSALLKCVLDEGYQVALHDVSEAATAPFLASHPLQVSVARTAREAASSADVIEIVVNTDQQLLAACLGSDGLFAGAQPGAVVLIHSTITHETLKRVAQAAAKRDLQLLDAMVSGARGQMSVPDLAVMVGGDAAAFARAKPVMDSYGSLVLHLGPQGSGLDAKLAMNMLRFIVMAGCQEAARFAERAGVGSALAQLVAHAECNRYVGDISKLLPYPQAQRVKEAELSMKDLRAAISRGTELGVQLQSAERAVDLMRRLWGAELS